METHITTLIEEYQELGHKKHRVELKQELGNSSASGLKFLILVSFNGQILTRTAQSPWTSPLPLINDQIRYLLLLDAACSFSKSVPLNGLTSIEYSCLTAWQQFFVRGSNN